MVDSPGERFYPRTANRNVAQPDDRAATAVAATVNSFVQNLSVNAGCIMDHCPPFKLDPVQDLITDINVETSLRSCHGGSSRPHPPFVLSTVPTVVSFSCSSLSVQTSTSFIIIITIIIRFPLSRAKPRPPAAAPLAALAKPSLLHLAAWAEVAGAAESKKAPLAPWEEQPMAKLTGSLRESLRCTHGSRRRR